MLGPMPGSNCATRKPATRSRMFCAQRRHRQDVLDVRGLQKLETAEFHERDIAPRELDFEIGAVMGGTEQDRLRLERDARLPALQDPFDDVAGLRGIVGDIDEVRPLRGDALRPEILGETFGCEIDHRVGGGQDRLRRTIIAIERDDLGIRSEVAREIEDVSDGRRTEGIDGLSVVTDHGQAAPVRLEREQDRSLQPIGVLVFIDQHVIEAL